MPPIRRLVRIVVQPKRISAPPLEAPRPGESFHVAQFEARVCLVVQRVLDRVGERSFVGSCGEVGTGNTGGKVSDVVIDRNDAVLLAVLWWRPVHESVFDSVRAVLVHLLFRVFFTPVFRHEADVVLDDIRRCDVAN